MKKFKTIGILGGGQLGKMLCKSAEKMDYTTIILDPNPDSCGFLDSTEKIISEYNDEQALIKLCEQSDIITYEFENVPAESIDFIIKNGGYIPQGKQTLYLSQHRVLEKDSVKKLGIKTVKYIKIENKDDLKNAIKIVGYPAILKTCTGGYDGKGQWKLQNDSDMKNLILDDRDYILEEMIKFDKEVSCLVVRGVNKHVKSFPIGENIHKNGILNRTIVPARISKNLELKIKLISEKIIEDLNIYGPLGIEYFIKGDEVYFNEMAPRPHNSAHYTMDGCNYSQFDLHLMSILNMSFPEIKLLKPTVMLNIMGEDKEKLINLKNDSEMTIHLYDKNDWRIGRKMGHINYCGDDLEKLIQKVDGFWEEKI